MCDRAGKFKQYRLLYCRTCKARFSERKGTVFFRSRMPREKVVSILRHVQEGVGMRKTGRPVRAVHETRQKGRVVSVATALVLGTSGRRRCWRRPRPPRPAART